MDDKKTYRKKNAMEISKENQDFQNIPESISHKKPPVINKKDVKRASELNNEGKTDNTDKN
jgi:hypothetical protein